MTDVWIAATLAFAVGLCVGVALDDAWDLYRASRKEKKMDDAQKPPTTREGGRFSTNTLAVLLIACCVALLAVGVSLIITRNATENYSRCTAEWQQQFSKAYVARTSAATEVSLAMDRVVESVQKQSQAEFDAAVKNYLSVRDKQNKDRVSNPLPPLPAVLCGDPR